MTRNNSNEASRKPRGSNGGFGSERASLANDGFEVKAKNMQSKTSMESAREFCDGLSKMVKGKIENKLKPFINKVNIQSRHVDKYDFEEENRLKVDDHKHRSRTDHRQTPRRHVDDRGLVPTSKSSWQLSNINENSLFDESVDLHCSQSDVDESLGRQLNKKYIAPPKRPPPPASCQLDTKKKQPLDVCRDQRDPCKQRNSSKHLRNPVKASIKPKLRQQNHEVREAQAKTQSHLQDEHQTRSSNPTRRKITSSSPIVSPIMSTNDKRRPHRTDKKQLEQPLESTSSRRLSKFNNKRPN
jgi:hypothetical protein